MNIKKTSWHYRAIVKFGFTPSKSLCMYFWQIPLIGLFFVFAFAAGLALAFSTAHAFAVPIALLMGSKTSLGAEINSGLVAVVFFWWVLVGMIAYDVCKVKFPRKKTKKKPSIITEYVKAKKQKICPIIEFKD